MTQEFKLPDLGEGLHEAEITEVLVKKGDSIKEGDSIFTVETDKASVEIPSPYTGVVADILVNAGDVVEVGKVLITFNGDGAAPAAVQAEQPAALTPAVEVKTAVSALAVSVPAGAPVAAAPVTRKLARELGIDIRLVPGSGPGGRITDEDVRAYAKGGAPAPATVVPAAASASAPAAGAPASAKTPGGVIETALPALLTVEDLALPDFSGWGKVEEIPLRSIRRAVAKKMAASWSQIPHVNHGDDADITELDKLRKSLKDEVEGGLTMTVFLIKAVVAALKQYPNFNASLDAERGVIIQKHFYNIGIATDTGRGLIVPVIRDADRKSLSELSKELSELVTRTREDKNTLDDIQRGTFTITNAGVLGGTHFSPIINYPQVAILGAARAAWKPVVQKDEHGRLEIVPRFILPLTVAFDHRVLDGGDGARFLNFIIKLLEKPEQLLLNL
jgi:pyruvate dehydrogenase E2 component (dihydrolipoamide acetyltransferase)